MTTLVNKGAAESRYVVKVLKCGCNTQRNVCETGSLNRLHAALKPVHMCPKSVFFSDCQQGATPVP